MRLVYLQDVGYSIGDRDLLKEVSFELRTGDRTALVGRNGSGKTTLIRILAGELAPHEGRVIYAANTALAITRQEPVFGNRSVREVLQEGFARLEKMEERLRALEANLGEAESYEAWEELHAHFETAGGYTRANRYREVLRGLRLEGMEERAADSLSGGEARRLELGRALLAAADGLLLDEPTNHLDIEMRAWLVEFLSGYKGGLLFVSHDRWFMNRLATSVAHLQRGRLTVYPGGYDAFRAAREEREAQALRAWQNWENRRRELEASLEQARRWAHSSEKQAVRKRALETRYEKLLAEEPPRPERAERNLRIRFPASPGPQRVLEAAALEKTYGSRKLFRVENLTVRRGECIALVGPNGAGKSTLLRMLLGELGSDDPAGFVRTGPGVRVGYYDQKLSGFDERLTLFETLHQMVGDKEAHNLLGAWLFPYEAQFKKVADLSGGERARLALLSLSLQEANLLVLDEPTNHLDLETIEALEEALASYDGTLIVVSHDLTFLRNLTNRTWRVEDGLFQDTPRPPEPTSTAPEKSATKATPKPRPAGRPRRKKSRWHTERLIERLETEIEDLHAQLEALHARAAEPGLGPEDYAAIAEEEHRLQTRLGQLEAEWERAVEELETS
ncbi:ABC-F family ATP-binding cassette domain-containing protein [Oceanithermus sp.]